MFNQTVNKANSRTVVTTSGHPRTCRVRRLSFTATVTAGMARSRRSARATVQFRDQWGQPGSPVALNASGQAAYPDQHVGRRQLHRMSAVYIGDGNFNASTSANTQTSGSARR